MGRKALRQPRDLPFKLKFIRNLLAMTQDELFIAMNHPRKVTDEERRIGRGAISDYEHGRRAPSLLEMLAYVKTVRQKTKKPISIEDLVDDQVKILDILSLNNAKDK